MTPPTGDDRADGFLVRWSRRKTQRRLREAPAEPPPAAAIATNATVAAPAAPAWEAHATPAMPAEPPAPAAPTLDDVAALTAESDFSRFVAPGVDGVVRNAALKKLFTDPHFNVMDGLDTYIDDCGRLDPLPEDMLRKMAQSQFLGLFTDEPEAAAATLASQEPPPMKTLICNCNRTMPLDLPALSRALAATPGASADGLEAAYTLLCRREAGAFQRAAKASGDAAEPLLVACTQESRLFVELNAETAGAAPLSVRPIHFVNIRETGGWSSWFSVSSSWWRVAAAFRTGSSAPGP